MFGVHEHIEFRSAMKHHFKFVYRIIEQGHLEHILSATRLVNELYFQY